MSSYATLGFPRASGDGPDRGAGISAQCVFPPRERGWSVLATAMEAIAVVSPARAGMVPTLMNALFSERGFPPRERGWSPRPWPRTCGAGVSPARAGMVPGCGLPPPRCHPRCYREYPSTWKSNIALSACVINSRKRDISGHEVSGHPERFFCRMGLISSIYSLS